MAAGDERMNIYRAARSIKRRENSLHNSLRSIYEDSVFVAEIAQLWPELPLLANLRCGLWYSSRFDSTCYFKSTDGHNTNWSFNTSRLNLHVATLAGQRGGCIIVDSTRKGKRFPDSMSKTIPIWACVLNRAIENRLRKLSPEGELESKSSPNEDVKARHMPLHWDSSLHLPLWVSVTEKAAIEDHLDEWTKQLEDSGADIDSLTYSLGKPLRPLWISQRTVIWLNEVPASDSWDFTPIILVSASSSNGISQHSSISDFSWQYIPGAGDDEESWARGLSANLFWTHAFELISLGPDLCNQKVAELVEKDRVYRVQRGEFAPQITTKLYKSFSNKEDMSSKLSDTKCQVLNFASPNDLMSTRYSVQHGSLAWIGLTNLAVCTTLDVENVSKDTDCVLNCDPQLISFRIPDANAYLHLPIVTSKFDRFSLLNSLPAALNFAKLNLKRGRKLLVCCHNGEDISVCVCLAILTCLFDDAGFFGDGRSFNNSSITKWEIRKRLVFICKFVTSARPSRGNIRQVFLFSSRQTLITADTAVADAV